MRWGHHKNETILAAQCGRAYVPQRASHLMTVVRHVRHDNQPNNSDKYTKLGSAKQQHNNTAYLNFIVPLDMGGTVSWDFVCEFLRITAADFVGTLFSSLFI